jgi:hypothetical protein
MKLPVGMLAVVIGRLNITSKRELKSYFKYCQYLLSKYERCVNVRMATVALTHSIDGARLYLRLSLSRNVEAVRSTAQNRAAGERATSQVN